VSGQGTNDPVGPAHGGLTCAEVTELAGLYVLDALEVAQRERVDAHLASCPEAHAEIAELGGTVPVLAAVAEPIAAPAALKARVLADYRTAQEPAPAPAVWQAPVVEPSRWYRRPSLAWTAAAAAVLVLAVAGGWAYTAQSRADAEAQRAESLAQAVTIMAQPNSSVAVLRGHDSAAGASGFAAFAADGAGYLVVVDLPAAPVGQAYQAWYIDDGRPASAGLLTVDADGFALLALPSVAGTDVMALTIEPSAGSAQPTSDPLVYGDVRPNA
jgi:anti-sigma-K factor RskA